MKKIIIFLIITISVTAYGDISFKSQEEKEKYNSFNDQEFSMRIKQVKILLSDFQKLTEKYLKDKHGKKWQRTYSNVGVKGIGSTGWEMQTIGFSNIPRYISGAYLKKSYENASLRFQLARFQLKEHSISAKEFDDIKKELEKAEKEMKDFIINLHYVD